MSFGIWLPDYGQWMVDHSGRLVSYEESRLAQAHLLTLQQQQQSGSPAIEIRRIGANGAPTPKPDEE